MSFQNAYLNSVMDDLRARYAHEPEYLQAVGEFLEPLSPVIDSAPRYEQQNIVGRMAEPERLICFPVSWVDDQGKTRLNHGFRVQHSSALGPYKGGLRFHPSVNQGTPASSASRWSLASLTHPAAAVRFRSRAASLCSIWTALSRRSAPARTR